MEIFRLLGTIAIENENANNALNETSETGSRTQTKLQAAFDKIGSAAAKVGKVMATGLAVGAAAIGALAKKALDNYADYEQLVGGVETLFKDSAEKVKQYANEAYKTAGMSANDYMETVTGFSASLLQSMATGTSKASAESIEATKEALDKQLEAVEEANDKQEKLIEEAHDKEIDDFEKLTEQKIELINQQYTENLKLIDEEKYRKIKAIDDQIDSINRQTEEERAAIEQRENEQKKASLQEKINNAKTDEDRMKAEQDLADFISDLEQKEREKSRKDQIEQLKEQKEIIKDEADTQKELLKKQHDEELKAFKEARDEQLKAMKKAQKEELEAVKKANDDKLKSFKEYVEEQKKLAENENGTAIYTSEVYEKAAEKANLAMIDMSDNANKMGTSIESIQNAYSGFAKQNFTMLDNLKLGYGGTKQEMQRLMEDAEKISGIKYDISSFSDIVDAIHVIQTEMGITGTTAKEASSTISGSIAAMKASFTNLVTGFGNDQADLSKLIDEFIESALTVADNVIPRVEIILNGIAEAIEKLIPIIAERLPGLIETILPALIRGATELIKGLVMALPTLIQVLIEQMPYIVTQLAIALVETAPILLGAFKDIFNKATSAISSQSGVIGDALSNVFSPEFLDNTQQAIDRIATFGQRLGETAVETFSGKLSGLQDMFSAFGEVIQPIIELYITGLLQAFENLILTVETVVLPIISGLIDIFVGVATSIAENIAPAVKDISDKWIEMCGLISDFYTENILPVIDGFIEMVGELWVENQDKITAIGELFGSIFGTISEIFAWFCDVVIKGIFLPAIEIVVTAVQNNMDYIKAAFQSAFDIIGGIIKFFTALFKGDWKGMWEAVKIILLAGYEFIQNALYMIIAFVYSILEGIFLKVKTVFENIRTEIANRINKAKEIVTTVFSAIKEKISEKLTAAKKTVTDIFDDIKKSISDKIEAAKETVSKVIDKIKGFFDFDWKLPNIKMPHVTIDGEFSLNPPKVPTFDIEWYKDGGIMNDPTMFGFNPASGKAMVGGEAGAEAIAPIDTLQKYVSEAVAEQNDKIIKMLNDGINRLIAFLDENMMRDMQIVMDTGALVGHTAKKMNKALGNIANRTERGVYT